MYIYQVERDLLKQAIQRHADNLFGEVLDVGSGPGSRYQDLFKRMTKLIRLDLSPDVQPDILGSADNMPIGDASVDGILCNQVIGDLLDPKTAVREMRRVLRPGGTVLLTEGFLNELHGEPRDYWRFTPFCLEGLFREQGFEVLHVSLIGGFFSTMCQLWTRFFVSIFTLYSRPVLGRLFGYFFLVMGKTSIFLDERLSVTRIGKKVGTDVIIVAKKQTNQ